tara:strand:- start:221 stop:2029 length:1809 start_codon:yes stop_codon:yes gene_type:complete
MNNNSHILNLSAYEVPQIVEDKRRDWVLYGKNNDYFEFLINNYKNSTTNNAIINNICRLVYGKGLSALDASKKPNEYAQSISLFSPEDLKKVILDFKMLGQGAFQIHYSKDRKKIIKALHIPVQLLGAEKCNENGEIEGYYYSDNWENVKKFPPKRIPAFGYSSEKIEILYFNNYTPGMKYYSCVDYVGGLSYCTLEEEISEYLINDVQNSFSSTKVVNFNNGIPTEEQQEIVSSKVMNKLTGSNGQKVIVSFNSDETSKTTVDDIQLNNAPEHYQYLADECMRKIMVAHNVTSPLLFGIASKNGFSSNADELKDSSILFDNMVVKPIQNVLIDALDKILAFNDVSLKLYFKTLQPLDFKDLEGVEDEEVIEEETGIETELNSLVLNDETKKSLIDNLDGEIIDEQEWELVDKRVFNEENESIDDWANRVIRRKKSNLTKLKDYITSYPNRKSFLDKDIYKVRYSYEEIKKGSKTGKSRDFCQHMMKRTDKGVRYRKEDIDMASFQGVNNKFGHKGQNYSLFKYKGGPNCYHFWAENLYRLKKKTDGSFYKDKSLASSEIVGELPYIVNPNGWKEAQIAPIDIPKTSTNPGRGYHPNNKRFQ